MAILFQSVDDPPEVWREHLQAAMPDADIRVWPDEVGDESEIDYALVWQPPAGMLKRFPNLKAIISLGAGVDHLASDPELPRDVPVVRMVDRGLVVGMTEFVTLAVLRHHRRLREYEESQRRHTWERHGVPLAMSRRVGILGLGVLGRDAADVLVKLRFDVAGWARAPKEVPGVTCYHGPDGLNDLLARTDILVCLLPLTEETEGILNADTLGRLPPGASVVNVARGGHVAEEDLLAALDSGQIGEATLDVFRDEPLPADHPFWSHPRVLVTPHVASITPPETAAKVVAETIRSHQAGEPLEHVVDFDKGY